MCIADIATNELLNKHSVYEISVLSKRQKHRNLNIEKANLDQASLYINLAHIAYISSRAEQFCEDVIEFVKEYTENRDSYNSESLDYMRKAIYNIHNRKRNMAMTNQQLSDEMYAGYIGEAEIYVIDYFRKLRNKEFHGGVDASPPIEILQNTKVKNKFGHHLCAFHEIKIKDVILYSRAWQSAAKNICSHIVEIDEELLREFKRRYSGYKEQRLNHAMRQRLSQDYLQSDYKINILENNGWVA